MRTTFIALTLLLAGTAVAVAHADGCREEPSHTYFTGSAAGAASATLLGGDDATATSPAGRISVWDTNATQDCNFDGRGGDWDGDYDWGVGGGAFGWGPWADEPICGNALNVHGPNVVVHDVVFGRNVAFVVGEDDQAGPVIIPIFTDVDVDARYSPPIRPEPTDWVCETDGSITPGDPSTDPTADADDCLSPLYTGTGTTCGSGGGDGLFWVFIFAGYLHENGGIATSNIPTEGIITAF